MTNAIAPRLTAIGLNFHDIDLRTGLYNTLPLLGIPGIEAAGPGAEGFSPGDRVAYVTPR